MFLRPLLAFVPGSLIGWINLWIAPFSKTILVHPHWQAVADDTILAAGAIVAAVIAIVFRKKRKEDLKNWAVKLLLAAMIGAFLCFVSYFVLTWVGTREFVEVVKTIWMFAYICMVLTAISAVVFAVLFALPPKRTRVRPPRITQL